MSSPLIPQTQKQRYLRRLDGMRAERQSYEQPWLDMDSYITPRRVRLSQTGASEQSRRGNKANSLILNSTATMAARSASSGLHTGITSPGRPWFRLRTPYPQLNELGPVKDYLYTVETRMREVFQRSNFYAVAPVCYADMLVFGTHCCIEVEDDEDVVRFFPLQPGTYWLAQSARLQVDTMFRVFAMTVRQVVDEFGGRDGQPRLVGQDPDWSRLSRAVRNLWERQQYEQPVDLVCMIEPNPDARRGAGPKRYDQMAWKTCYFEQDGPTDGAILREAGYEESPLLAPRWSVDGEAVYGRSPGMDGLPDVKQLQTMEKRKLQAIELYVNPPTVAPTAMRGKGVNMLPGGRNFFDGNAGTQQVQPLMTVKPEIQYLLQEIATVEDRINRQFFVDLFLAISSMGNDPRRNITAREIDERTEEKLLMLGPVLERLNGEWLDPVIDRTYAIMQRKGLLPDPPEELQGVELRVEYISMLFQAQRAIGTASLERIAAFATQIATVHPDVLDKIDFDQTMDEYGDMQGLPPRVVRPDDAVLELRAQRQKAQQAQMAAQSALPVAQAAKAASETSMEGDTALTRALTGMSGVPA